MGWLSMAMGGDAGRHNREETMNQAGDQLAETVKWAVGAMEPSVTMFTVKTIRDGLEGAVQRYDMARQHRAMGTPEYIPPAQLITEVSYERLQSFGNYENERIGVVINVPPNFSPVDTLAYAKEWVEKQLAKRTHSRVAQQVVEVRQAQLESLERLIKERQEHLKDLNEMISGASGQLETIRSQAKAIHDRLDPLARADELNPPVPF
jgi:hypothetical protein